MGWLLATALAASAVLAFLRCFAARPEEALLAGVLIALGEAVVVSLGLGLARRLTPGSVLAATLLLCALHAALALWDRPAPVLRGARWPAALWPAAAAAAAVLAARLALSAALPFESWDGLSYHLPIVWRWLQQGDLSLAGWSGPQRYFPPNAELLAAWLALLSGGALQGAKNAQALALPLWAACGASLGRRLAGTRWSAACALALAALPLAVIQAGIPYVDLTHAALWTAAAACALVYDRSGRFEWLMLWALAFGLSLGAKATLYFQAPLLIQPLATLSRRGWPRLSWRRGAALAALALLCGGYAYLRNWIERGDPVFPYTFRLAGRAVFQGIAEPGELLVTVERWFVPRAAAWLWYPWRETMRGAVGYSSENGFGALFAAGWALWPLAAWRARGRRDRGALAFYALIPAVAALFMTLHPTREPRYVIFLAAPVIVGAAAALRALRGRALLGARAAWTLGLVWGLAGVAAYAGSDPGLSRAWKELRDHGRVDPREYYRWQYGSLGEAWAALDARLAAGDVVATNYGELTLPLAGVPARARVEVVSTRASDYPETLAASSAGEWLSLLERRGVRYFLLWSPAWYPGEGARERAFIESLPGRFTPLGRWDSPGLGPVELYGLESPTRSMRPQSPEPRR